MIVTLFSNSPCQNAVVTHRSVQFFGLVLYFWPRFLLIEVDLAKICQSVDFSEYSSEGI